MPIVISESAILKLGINKSSIKSVTLPPSPVNRLQPLSERFPSAPPKIKMKE